MIFKRIRMTDARFRCRQEVQTELAEWVEVEPRTWMRRVRAWDELVGRGERRAAAADGSRQRCYDVRGNRGQE